MTFTVPSPNAPSKLSLLGALGVMLGVILDVCMKSYFLRLLLTRLLPSLTLLSLTLVPVELLFVHEALSRTLLLETLSGTLLLTLLSPE